MFSEVEEDEPAPMPKLAALRSVEISRTKRKTSSVSRVMARLTHQDSLAGMIRKGSTKHLMGHDPLRSRNQRVTPTGLQRGDSRKGFVPGVSSQRAARQRSRETAEKSDPKLAFVTHAAQFGAFANSSPNSSAVRRKSSISQTVSQGNNRLSFLRHADMDDSTLLGRKSSEFGMRADEIEQRSSFLGSSRADAGGEASSEASSEDSDAGLASKLKDDFGVGSGTPARRSTKKLMLETVPDIHDEEPPSPAVVDDIAETERAPAPKIGEIKAKSSANSDKRGGSAGIFKTLRFAGRNLISPAYQKKREEQRGMILGSKNDEEVVVNSIRRGSLRGESDQAVMKAVVSAASSLSAPRGSEKNAEIDAAIDELDPETVSELREFQEVALQDLSALFRLVSRSSFSQLWLTIISLILMVIENELWYNRYDWDDDSAGTAAAVCVVLRTINATVTLCLLWAVYTYYSACWQITKIQYKFLYDVVVWPYQLLRLFLIEIVVCAICPLPGIDFDVDLSLSPALDGSAFYFTQLMVSNSTPMSEGDAAALTAEMRRASLVEAAHTNLHRKHDWLGLFMFLRMYVLFRYLMVHKHPQSVKHLIRAFSDFEMGFKFTVKSMMAEFHLAFIFTAFGIVILLGSYSFAVCERAAVNGTQQDFSMSLDFSNALYLTMITITTVGYGDVSPSTTCGRGVSVLLSVFTVLMTAVMVAVINSQIRMTREELRFFRLFRKDEWHRNFKGSAASAIQSCYRYHRLKRRVSGNGMLDNARRSLVERRLLMSLQRWQHIRRTLNAAFQEKDHMLVPMVENVLVQNGNIMTYMAMLDEGIQDVEDSAAEQRKWNEHIRKGLGHMAKIISDTQHDVKKTRSAVLTENVANPKMLSRQLEQNSPHSSGDSVLQLSPVEGSSRLPQSSNQKLTPVSSLPNDRLDAMDSRLSVLERSAESGLELQREILSSVAGLAERVERMLAETEKVRSPDHVKGKT